MSYTFRTILARGEFKKLDASVESWAVPNTWRDALNVRFENRSYRPRGGRVEVAPSPGAGACVGGFYDGVTGFVGMNTAGVVTLWRRFGGSWSTISAAAGPYGDTRMSAPARLLTVTPIRDPEDSGFCIQDNVGRPVYYNATYGAVRVPASITAPTPWPVEYTLTSAMTVSSSGTPGGTSATFTTITAGAGAWEWTINATVTSGNIGTITAGGATIAAGQVQVVALVELLPEDFIRVYDQCFALEFMVGANVGIRCEKYPQRVPTKDPDIDLLVFSGTVLNTGAITAVRLNATAGGSWSGGVLRVLGLALGGDVPGGAQYEASYAMPFAESASVVLPNVASKAFPGASAITNWQLPITPDIRYVTRQIVNASPDALTGISRVNIYRQDPSDDKAYRVIQLEASEYPLPSGPWAYTLAFGSTVRRTTFTDDRAPEDKNYEIPAPGPFCDVTPIGRSFFAGGRHYVGGNGVVKVSDDKFPTRFRAVTLNPDDGLEYGLESGEVVNGFTSSSGSIIGRPSVFCHTNRGTILLGPRAARVSSIPGAGYGADSEGPIYLVTEDGQCAVMAGSSSRISRSQVDSLVTNVAKSSVAAWRDRVYFCFGATVLVYNTMARDWESRDSYANLVQIQGGPAIYGFRLNGAIDQLEATADTDLGAAFTCSLETGIYGVEDSSISIRRFHVLTSSGVQITTTRTPFPGTASTATIPNGIAAPQWRTDSGAEGFGVGVSLKVEWPSTGTVRLIEWRAEVDGQFPDRTQ